MTALRFIEIDGKRYLWCELLRRREQRQAAVEPEQNLRCSNSVGTAARLPTAPLPGVGRPYRGTGL
jgi:hypothetical protein